MPLLLLAFEAALYPTLLAAVVILLTLERPARLLAAYLAGGLTISVGIGVAIVLALGETNAVESQQSVLGWGADLAFGGLALLLAFALATRQDERVRERRRRRRAQPSTPLSDAADEAGREPWSQRLLSGGSVPIVFFAALFVNLPGAAYLIALKDIAAGDHTTVEEVLLILLFNGIMFLLAEIPLVGLLVAPERTGAMVRGMNEWLSSHSRQLAIGICLVFGVFLIVRGLVHA